MDLHHAARVVVRDGPHSAAQLCWHAHVADKYVKRFRRLHPLWGDGSLRAAALAQNAAGAPCDAAMLHALAVVATVLRKPVPQRFDQPGHIRGLRLRGRC